MLMKLQKSSIKKFVLKAHQKKSHEFYFMAAFFVKWKFDFNQVIKILMQSTFKIN